MRIFLPLRSAPVALLWGGLSLSAIGDQLYSVALTWIAVALLGPKAGYLTAMQPLVLLLAVLGIGRWADRYDPRRAMVVADLARAGILTVCVLAWFAFDGPGILPLGAAVVVLAVGQAVFQPALQSVLPDLVTDRGLLPAANGLLDATDRSARLLGPGLIGLLAGVVPVVHFLSIDAASFAISAAALLLIGRVRPGVMGPGLAGSSGPRRAFVSGILQGVRAMRGHPILGFVLSVTAPINGAWVAVFYLGLPLLIERQGVRLPGSDGASAGLGAYGLVISAYGCTNLAATLFLGGRPLPRRPQYQMFAGNVVVGCGIVLLGLATVLPPAWLLPGLAAASGVAAVGGPMKDIPLAVLRQTRLRPPDMAPAMRAYMAASSAGMLAALIVAPGLFAALGTVRVIAFCGLVIMGVGVLGLVRLAGYRAM